MPLDVAKTQMQINPGLYSSPIDALTKIGRQGGPQALFYGMPSFLTQTSAKGTFVCGVAIAWDDPMSNDMR